MNNGEDGGTSRPNKQTRARNKANGPGRTGLYRRRRKPAKTYGALDLGTNNCRLLIAKPTVDGFRVVTSFSRIVRLGEGMAEDDRLCEDAMDRTIEALDVCAGKLEQFDVARTRNIATEACRRAVNCGDFIERIESRTGLTLETISSREEARLALAGCKSLLADDPPHALVFDIGGGSTELVWAVRDGGDGFRIADTLSLPIGVVTLSEICGTGEVSRDAYENMVETVARHLPAFCRRNRIASRVGQGRVQMLGTSGTVTTLGAVHLELPRYSRSHIDGLHIDFDALERASDRLTGMDYDGRAAIPCIGHERAELVVPGCAILEAICRCWPVGSLRIADRGLREGILLELMAMDRVAAAQPAA